MYVRLGRGVGRRDDGRMLSASRASLILLRFPSIPLNSPHPPNLACFGTGHKPTC